MVNYHYEEIQVFKGPSCRGLSNIGWEDNMKQTLKDLSFTSIQEIKLQTESRRMFPSAALEKDTLADTARKDGIMTNLVLTFYFRKWLEMGGKK